MWWEGKLGTLNCYLRAKRTVLSFCWKMKTIDDLKGLGFERVYWCAKEHWAAGIRSHTGCRVSHLPVTENWALLTAASLAYFPGLFVITPCLALQVMYLGRHEIVTTVIFVWPCEFLSCGICMWYNVYLLLTMYQPSPSYGIWWEAAMSLFLWESGRKSARGVTVAIKDCL